MALPKRRKPQTRVGLLPEARLVVLPTGIASTAGPSHIAVANKVGLGLDPWQADIARLLWAKQADGSPAADTVCLSIARQAGKTYAIAANVFAECLITPNTTAAWTAHHNKVMLETFNSLKVLAQSPLVAAHVRVVRSSAEDRSIHFTNGSRIVMAARESGALRGVAKVRILVLDEAQILTESALSDIAPTQNQAANPIMIMMGTPPKPRDPSEVWVTQRQQALDAEKSGSKLELACWIEFSADDDAETDDHAQWRKANPSYPKRTPLRAIRKLRRTLSEDHFRREALGIWDDKSVSAVVDPGVWASLLDDGSRPVSKLVLGVDVSPDRGTASVALAGLRGDDLVHVELYESRDGTGWLVDWLADRCANNPIAGVVIDAKSPAASFVPRLRKARCRVVATNTDDVANACAEFYDACMDATVRHTGQVQLTRSLNSATKRSIGDRWAWNRRTNDADITAIVAATLAVWGVNSKRVRARPQSPSRGVVLAW